ncbi:MAG: CRISPR-associated protein Cas4, partial [Proteobacteria bacterium]|nr:CRISPR-associated protein Cas4 [Pseudomonadota bacterium]
MILIPARMLNEHAYCPRLFALEWLNGDWAESADTVRGQTVHRQVDMATQKGLQQSDNVCVSHNVRSVDLGDAELGLIAKIDVVEQENGRTCPVDYKKGRPPKNPEQSWEPERVQLCAQGLLLQKHGYKCDKGVLYFAGAKRRVEVLFDEALVETTLAQRDAAREVLQSGQLPPPLIDSPKCPRCSLVGICLPDEQNVLNGHGDNVRPMIPSRDDGVPLYLELQGGKLSKDHDEILVREKGSIVERVRIANTSRVVVSGSASITTPLL